MMSDYEKLRLDNIARNQAFLESIGLGDVKKSIGVINERDAAANAVAPSSSSSSSKSRRGVKRTALPTSETVEGKHVRRSNRGSVSIGAETHASGLDGDASKRRQTQSSTRRKSSHDINVDHATVERKKLSADQLRQYIETRNGDHAEQLKNKDIIHSAYRISYMSNQALATRISMISSGTGKQSRDKMLIFYYALCASGLPELAASALRVLRKWQVEGLPES